MHLRLWDSVPPAWEFAPKKGTNFLDAVDFGHTAALPLLKTTPADIAVV